MPKKTAAQLNSEINAALSGGAALTDDRINAIYRDAMARGDTKTAKLAAKAAYAYDKPHEKIAALVTHLAKKSRHRSAASGTRRATKRVSHAVKVKTNGKINDKINIDQLAKLFDLPDWDRIDERNQQHYWEMARGAGDDEDAQQEAEQEAQSEVYGQWYDAVESAASKLFEEHGLELDPTGKQGTKKRRYDFKIVPSKSWNDAADKLRETINGVGDLHFDNLSEFLKAEASTARQAVLSHLGYIKRYPAVYGGLGANQLYEHAWR